MVGSLVHIVRTAPRIRRLRYRISIAAYRATDSSAHTEIKARRPPAAPRSC